ELAGILTGVLLVATILIDGISKRMKSAGTTIDGENRIADGQLIEEEIEVRNSQVAILSAVILAATLIVAGSNWMLTGSLRQEVGNGGGQTSTRPTATGRKPVIAMMPKAKGDPYFVSCKQGADEAARELGVELLWDGPTDLDPAKQNEVVEAW